MKRWRNGCALLLGVLAQCAWAGQPAAEIPARLSLEEALDIAFRQSPLLRRAQAQLAQAGGQAGQARAALLPQVSVGLAENLQTTNLKAMGIDIPFAPTRVGPFQSVDARAYVSFNVWNQGARETDKAAREQLAARTAQSGFAREHLAAQVALAYAGASRAQSSAATLASQEELAGQLLKIARDRFAAGVASTVDVKRAAQQVNNLRQARLEADNALVAAKLQLARLLNARITWDYRLEGMPAAAAPMEAASPEDAVARALNNRADYRAARNMVQAAGLRLSAARAQRYPVVQFRGDYGQSGRKPFENLNTFRLQGTLTLPVFTGGRISGEEQEARGKLDEAAAQADELRAAVEAEVLAAYAGVRLARQQVEVAEAGIQLAKDELELASARFTSGIADNTEVVNAQDRLSRAEDNAVRARYALESLTVDYMRAAGQAESAYRTKGVNR